MKSLKLILTLLFIGIFTQSFSQTEEVEEKAWEKFELETLSQQRAESGKPWMRFIDRPSMFLGIYALGKDAEDGQQPHKLDEVYYITRGECQLKIEGEDYPLTKGSVAFVKAGADHKFHSISDDMESVVVFVKANPDAETMAGAVYDSEMMRKTFDAEENVWNPFLDIPTMTFGLYMLPKKLGGDKTLTHKVDEVNIVVKGSATFRVGEETMEVKPGSIVHVADGNGHSFEDLSEDFEVLILFEKRE